MTHTFRRWSINWYRSIAIPTLMLMTLLSGNTAVSAQEVRGWGTNVGGSLGDGTNINRFAPVRTQAVSGIGSLIGITAVTAGTEWSLALQSNGRVLGWGSNGFGQIGDGTDLTRFTPVSVLDPVDPTGKLTGIIALSAGNYHSLALKSNGTVVAWGFNGSGQLGDNHVSGSQSLLPVQVHGVNNIGNLTGVTAISAGNSHSLALKSNGTVVAWGNNTVGQIGSSTANILQYIPLPVMNSQMTGDLTGISAISAGHNFNLALRSDGAVFAWGANDYGQLGDNTNMNHSPYASEQLALRTWSCSKALASAA